MLLLLCASIAVEQLWPSRFLAVPARISVSDAVPAIPATIRALRPTYPYSVIPGGVYATGELRAAMRSDPAIRAHYADFHAERIHFVTLAADCTRYVSYRYGNQIFWTSKKLHIPKGELLVTDGENYARARCGNRMAERPSLQISSLEPPAGALSTQPFTLTDTPAAKNTCYPLVPGSEMAMSDAEFPLQFHQLSLPNTIPNVVTGAARPNLPAGGLPGEFLSPWLPLLLVTYNSPAKPTDPGAGADPVKPPFVPLAIPEPDHLLLVGIATFGVAVTAWRRSRIRKIRLTSGGNPPPR